MCAASRWLSAPDTGSSDEAQQLREEKRHLKNEQKLGCGETIKGPGFLRGLSRCWSLTLAAAHCYTYRMTTKTAAIRTAKCTRCGRTLTDPKSVAAKLGPKCARRRVAEQRAAAVIAKHQPVQVDKAIELIGDAAIVATSRGTFAVVSSNGVDRYTTTSIDCTCPAGTYGRTCYHRVAAELMLTAG